MLPALSAHTYVIALFHMCASAAENRAGQVALGQFLLVLRSLGG